jgi:hypothetical protein
VFTTYNQDFDLGKFRAELVIEYWHFMGDYSCYTSVLLLLYKAVLQTERHKKCFDVVQTLGLSILEIDDTSREIHPLQMHAARFLPRVETRFMTDSCMVPLMPMLFLVCLLLRAALQTEQNKHMKCKTAASRFNKLVEEKNRKQNTATGSM